MVGDARALNEAGLARLLELRAPLFAEDAHRRWLLSLPPFRPHEGHPLHAIASTLVPRATALPGAVLLVGEHRGRGALFWVAPDDPPERLIPFRGEAREQVELARTIVPRALPALVEPSALDAVALGARRAVLEASDPGARDGASFGLAICLAFASRLLDEPIPADLSALARVDESGRCLSVGHLEAKLDVLSRWALGVRRVLVVRDQCEEADRVNRTIGATLTIVPVESLSEALRAAFGDIEARLRERWAAEPERARRAAKDLLSLARDGYHQLLDWGAVASAARGLADRLDGDERWMAELADHIASRHQDAPRAIELHEDWLARQPRPHRLTLWAPLVQSAADGVDEWRSLLNSARAQLAPVGDEHPEDLELAGALGRAHAACYEHDEARTLLERAATGWLALERAHEGSYAVAELVRVAGVTSDASYGRRVRELFAPPVLDDPRTTHVARAFLHVALGRMCVQIGDARGALAFLDETSARWEAAPAHARAARLRWRAEVLDELGESGAARALRARLEAEHATGDGQVVALLARLDRADRAGALASTPEWIAAHPILGRELRRIEARLRPADPSRSIQLLRRHSRY